MASAGFGKVRPKKQRASGKPYDADRKESFLGRMKSKVKDMLTPSWLYAPADAAANGSDDDDGGESVGPGGGRDGGPDERADGSAVQPSVTRDTKFATAAAPPATSKEERASAETGPVASEQQRRRAPSASSHAIHPVLAEPRRAYGAAAAAAAASTAQGGIVASSLFPSPDIRKRVRRDFFRLAEDGAPVKKQCPAGGASSADGASTSSSLAAIPDDSDAYQRDILLMSKRSLEHHKHDLSPKESESTESELTCTASASDKSAAAVHASSSYATDGSSLNGPALQSVRPSFSVTTFTSSFTSLNESTSFLNAPASGESSFYAGKTTFGGASAHRRTPLTVSVQPSTRSTLFTKRAQASGATAVTSATAKRILDTLEKIASPAPAIVRSRDLGTSSISQSAADTLLAFKPLPYLSRRKVQPASKLTTGVSSQSVSGAMPPLAKLPTINAAGTAGRRDALARGSSGVLKTDLFSGHPNSLSTKAEAAPSNGLQVSGSTDVPQQFNAASASGTDTKAGGKLKPSKERGRAHYTRPAASADDIEPIPFMPTLSTAFTLPAGSVKGFDILGAKPSASTPSLVEAMPTKPSTAEGSVAHAPFSFSSPVALHSSIPDTGAQKQPDIKPFTFRNPADVDKGAAVVTSLFPKAGGSKRSASEGVAPSVPTSAAGLTAGASSGVGASSAWGGTLLAGRPASGSWVCDACMVSNDSGSGVCCACGSRKQEPPEKAAAVAPLRSAVPAVIGGAVDIFKQPQAGWECSVCLLRNGADKTKCVACNSAKATSAVTTVQPGMPKIIDIFKQPTGGWECTTCLVRNTSDKVLCAACGTRKPSAEAPAPAAAQQSAPVAVDIFKTAATGWECGECLVRNSSESTKCAACGSAKAGPATTQRQQQQPTPSPAVDIFKQSAAGWECATCLVRNSSDKSKCAACNSARQVSSGAPTSSGSGTTSSVASSGNGFADIFKVPSGSWSCTECFVQNKADVLQCAACGGRKPGVSGSAIQSKLPAADASGLLSGSSQAISSDQSKATTAIKFGGASSGGSTFGVTFKPLPAVPKFGGELPLSGSASSPWTTSSADKDVQSGAAPSGNVLASGLKLPAFTSFGGMPSANSFGASSLTGPGPAKEAGKEPLGQNVEDLPKAVPGDAQTGSFKSTSAFGVQPTLSSMPSSGITKPTEESPSSARPFSTGGSSDNAAGFAAPSSFLFGNAKQPSISFGRPVKEEAKDSASETQQFGQLPSVKPTSTFGGLQSSVSIIPPAAPKLEAPIATAPKPFVFGASAPTGGGLSIVTPGASSGLPSEVTPKPQISVFGNSAHQPPSSAAPAVTSGTAFVFGGPPQAGGSASMPTAGFAFGTAPVQPKSQSADPASTFKFGSTVLQPQGSSDVAPKNPAAVFGSASAQLQAALSTPAGAFSFGGASAQSAEANSSKGGFGQQSAIQSSGFNFTKAAALPPTGAASGLFQFGGPQKTEPDRGSGSFAFGSGITAASSASFPLFGGSAPAQPGENAGTSSSEPNPFAPSQGLAGRTIRKIPRKFSK